jgi:hypothetical protein
MFPHWAETGLGENLLKSERKETEVGTIPYPKEKLREEVMKLMCGGIEFTPRTALRLSGDLCVVRLTARTHGGKEPRCDIKVQVVPHALRADLPAGVKEAARKGLDALARALDEPPGVRKEAALHLARLDGPRWRAEDIGRLVFRLKSRDFEMEAATDAEGRAWFGGVGWDETYSVQFVADKVGPMIPVAATRSRHEEETLAALLAFAGDESWQVRASAAEDLADLGSETALEALLRLAEDPHAEVRAAAAEALGSVKREVGLKPLLALASDEDGLVREGVACALGKVQGGAEDKEVRDALHTLAKDRQVDVRIVAREVLGLPQD